jgi:hypothetical protein
MRICSRKRVSAGGNAFTMVRELLLALRILRETPSLTVLKFRVKSCLRLTVTPSRDRLPVGKGGCLSSLAEGGCSR